MRFYHGTSVRGWLGILKSGSMDSKKIGDSRVSALYSKFKGNYLTTNRKIAEMYANKIGKGVVIEIEYDPLAPGRVNNFKEQQAAGKDYFVEETALQVDGPDCSIDTKDPLMTKAKMRGDINKTNEVYMERELNLEREWQKLEESFTESAFAGLKTTPQSPKPAIQVSTTNKSMLPPQKAIQINKQADKMKQANPNWNPAEDSMFEGGIDLSIYEFGDQIMASADEQGLTLDQNQINAANDRIVSALQGEGMRNPHNLEAIIDDAVYDAADVTRSAPLAREPEDFYDDGIMESIDHSLKLLKQLKK